MQDETKLLKPGGTIIHKLWDYYDLDRVGRSPELGFSKQLKNADRFEFDGVTYEVTDVMRGGPKHSAVIVKMVRYQIPDTATQFVHKCPAKKDADSSMSRDDIMKIPAKRVKMQSHNRLEIKCPHCKTIFWKKNHGVPDEVQVDKTFKKKKKGKR